MPNVGQIIHAHNKRMQQQTSTRRSTDVSATCNCRNKSNCPLKGKCLEPNIVYQANVHHEQQISKYIGITEPEFKSRYNVHGHSFRDPTKKLSTELSKKNWELKDNDIDYTISWEILQSAQRYSAGRASCDLCTSEKFHILKAWDKSLLNSRSELVSKCRHARKFSLLGVT